MWNWPIKEVPAETGQDKLEMVLRKFYQGY